MNWRNNRCNRHNVYVSDMLIFPFSIIHCKFIHTWLMTPGNPLAVCGAELLLRGGGAEAAIVECAIRVACHRVPSVWQVKRHLLQVEPTSSDLGGRCRLTCHTACNWVCMNSLLFALVPANLTSSLRLRREKRLMGHGVCQRLSEPEHRT